ncbi:putative holin [Ectopseudomonas toyotomiensis]|uniref:Putative 2/3 transmembrane domain holin n=1 Tax=Ectopseudomonas toyotomiensis TaxID=554344 RepID=A0A1I5Z527_9GAMM|nr:putative holin [Pseudomonas toyotomiensis]SFQ51558.1 Putative 2/3 transmembrane domain holin [Pseudomonas toyotomiensis]
MSQACKPKRRLPRMTVLAVISLMLLVAIWFVRPEQLQVVLYKISLVTIGGVLGYWVDYAIFYGEACPQEHDNFIDHGLAWLRKALIVLACILGLTLGL